MILPIVRDVLFPGQKLLTLIQGDPALDCDLRDTLQAN